MAKKESKQNKNKRSFIKDFKAELKKVVWPTPKQLLNNTIAVITIVFITAAIVFVLDFLFEILNKHGIEKVKDIVVNDTSVTETVDNNTSSPEEANSDQASGEQSEEVTNDAETNIENNVE